MTQSHGSSAAAMSKDRRVTEGNHMQVLDGSNLLQAPIFGIEIGVLHDERRFG